MKKAICPGSFDPVTMGHLDIIRRASNMFDEVVVAVMNNSAKVSTFTIEKRMDFIERALSDAKNVTVGTFSGLLIDYCREINASAIVKGLRAISDYEYEVQIALLNKNLDCGIETVFLTSAQEYMFLSSSIVREVGRYGGDITKFVHPLLHDEIKCRLCLNTI